MEKEFVPYELALRMKQLGFDEHCFRYIYTGDTGNNYDHYLMGESKNYNEDMLCISQPLFQQAFRWFREKYSLYTELHKKFDGIGASIILSEYRYDMIQENKVEYHIPKYFGHKYKTYEEAELASLDKLIEIVEEKNKV
jgi:hypothetical protein